jgi:copper chaperone
MKTILRSEQLSCPSCIGNIESSLHKLDGVTTAKVHFNTGRIEIDHDENKISKEALVEAVRKTGYESAVSPY